MTKLLVEGYTGQLKKPYQDDPWPTLYAALQSGEILQEMVTGIERLEDKRAQLVVGFSAIKGVIPPDEVGQNLNTKTSLIGQRVAFKVKACDRPNGVVYLSRKAAIEEMAQRTWAYIEDKCQDIIKIHNEEVAPAKAKLATLENQSGSEAREAKAAIREAYRRASEISPTLTGVVRWVTAKGASVDIGGLIAFMPVTEATWSVQKNCRAVLKAGEAVDVKILDINPETKQILLSRKALIPDPWLTVEQKYQVGGVYFGVVRMVGSDYVVVEIEPGVVGLAFRPPMEEIPEGTQVVTKLLKFDIPKRRLSLNLTRVLERGA
jgi:small subunit ribosomal protein S1